MKIWNVEYSDGGDTTKDDGTYPTYFITVRAIDREDAQRRAFVKLFLDGGRPFDIKAWR